LRRGWRLAIASNETIAQPRRKIARNGLADHVDVIVVSEEAGADKPDARVFRVVAQRCGAPLSAADWMVGDDPTRDVGGAAPLGLRTVWMRRDRAWDPAHGAGPTRSPTPSSRRCRRSSRTRFRRRRRT
jgi:putative hydrolase of the HAD superfamily